jgi:hypothetical protein
MSPCRTGCPEVCLRFVLDPEPSYSWDGPPTRSQQLGYKSWPTAVELVLPRRARNHETNLEALKEARFA